MIAPLNDVERKQYSSIQACIVHGILVAVENVQPLLGRAKDTGIPGARLERGTASNGP